MNILYLNSMFYGGGAEKITRQLYYGMREQNIKSHMVVGFGESSDEYDTIYKTSIAKSIQILKGCLQNNQLISAPKSLKYVLKVIEEKNIDIIHINNAHGNYIGINDIAELSKKCKVIWTLHDMWAFTGHCAYTFECDKWKNSNCKECRKKRSYPAFYYNDLEKKYTAKRKAFTNKGITFVTPSLWLENKCRESFLRDENIITIHNGLQSGDFEPLNKCAVRKKYGLLQEKKYILFVAANVKNPFKGFKYLVKALELLENKNEYGILIVGDGADESIFSKEFSITKLGVIKDTKKMNEAYALADIFVLPSMADNFPTVAMESMASGTPVVGFNTGGIPEIVSEEVGFLVKTGDSNALASMIQNALIDKDVLKEKALKGIEKISKQFTLDEMLHQYRKLYESFEEQR